MKQLKYPLISAICLSTLALTGCDDDNTSMTAASPSTTSISGTAAIGSPIANAQIDLKCNGYNKTAAATTNSQGQWSARVPPANLPCVSRLTGGMVGTTANTQTLYSITTNTGTSITANITPLADLILARTVNANTGATLDNWYAGTTLAATLNTTISQLAANIAVVLSQLTTQGYTLPSGTLNPFTTSFTATTTNSYDQLLEQIGQAITASSSHTYNQFRTNYIAGANFPTAPVVTPPTGGVTCASLTKPKATSSDFAPFIGTYQVKIGSATTAIPLTIAANGNITLNSQTATASDICGPFVQTNGQGLLILAKKTTDIQVNVFKDTAGKITTEGPDFTSASGDYFFGELGGSTSTTCTTPSIETTFSTSTTGGLYANGQNVCFTASTTTLAFNGKTLTSPVKNTAVSLPFSAYAFTDGTFKYEVVFNGSALHEINLMNNTTFVGQFAPPVTPPVIPPVTPPTTSQVNVTTAACTMNGSSSSYGKCGASAISDFSDTLPTTATYDGCTISKSSGTITATQGAKTISAILNGENGDSLSISGSTTTVIASSTVLSNGVINGPTVTLSIVAGKVSAVSATNYVDTTPATSIVCFAQ